MAESLRSFLESEFPVIPTEMRVLCLLAYDAVAEFQRTLDPRSSPSELSDEDVIARLQDPRAFGLFARRVIDSRVSREVKIGVAERAFDLIPLPVSEHAVFSASERTPPGLLRLARFLLENEAFTVLHLLHLVYAAFVDPSLVRSTDRRTGTWILIAIVAREEFPRVPRLLLAFQFLSTLPDRDGSAALHAILRAGTVDVRTKRSLATVASASDGGRAWFAATAVQEGLLPPPTDSLASEVELEARVPSLSENIRARARRWLTAHATGSG